jgi:hypothetical protein
MWFDVGTLWALDWNATGKLVFGWVLLVLLGELLPLALLVCCWWIGEQSFTTKVVLTFLYVAHFGLLLVPLWLPDVLFLYAVSKPILIAILGGSTFGWKWLTRNPYGGNK